MNFLYNQLENNLHQPHGMLLLISSIIAIFCTMVLFIAIAIDFTKYHNPTENKKKIRSKVDTYTMFLYFFGFCKLMSFAIGRWNTDNSFLLESVVIIGDVLIVIGCYFNVIGRLVLKGNWANQVTIYEQHTFVSSGAYGIVRHPLYASIIWMLIGGSLIYRNWLAMLSVFVIFIPMMYYRARQEEKLLEIEFPEYVKYKQRVSMFFPKIFSNGKV